MFGLHSCTCLSLAVGQPHGTTANDKGMEGGREGGRERGRRRAKGDRALGSGVTGRSSSPQTRPDDEEGSGSVRCAALCCVAVSNLGHGLGLRLNEK
ncbi:unnamed protein product [Pleuronectes platessa]|uniref:Uncharacterized protein n=1 Tax=Pleuronectes platessa TaxID=8262 RepID=A0A9N7TVQ1_PLEPL|nr:unnamed protein product [Pleuronectes platessa]